jgi:hypothetical protein
MAVQSRIVLEPSAQSIVDATSTPPLLYELEPMAGVPVTTVRYDGVVHDFMLLNVMSEARATRAAIAQATAFLRQALGTE